MTEEIMEERRSRGRPQVRSDEETKVIVLEAASEQFQKDGFASANISAIARAAGISTKTLYRLYPTKAELFSEVISAKIGRYLLTLEREHLDELPLAQALERLLVAYGKLTLSDETINMTRLVMSESDRFPEIASVFYARAIKRTTKVIEDWLSKKVKEGELRLPDVSLATGMLRGMMAMEPQRAVMLRQTKAITSEQIVERARSCAKIFLNGCSS